MGSSFQQARWPEHSLSTEPGLQGQGQHPSISEEAKMAAEGAPRAGCHH